MKGTAKDTGLKQPEMEKRKRREKCYGSREGQEDLKTTSNAAEG